MREDYKTNGKDDAQLEKKSGKGDRKIKRNPGQCGQSK
jgi:hypothetical protein